MQDLTGQRQVREEIVELCWALHALSAVLLDALLEWGVAPEFYSETEKRIKLASFLKSWDEELQTTDDLYYYYTSIQLSKQIAKSGFKVSNIGMQSNGFCVVAQSPIDPSFEHQWPAKEWKEQMLRSNYADEWQDPAKENLVNSVIVLHINREWLKPVDNKPGALLLSDSFYRDHKGFIAKDLIRRVIVLYTNSSDETGDQLLQQHDVL